MHRHSSAGHIRHSRRWHKSVAASAPSPFALLRSLSQSPIIFANYQKSRRGPMAVTALQFASPSFIPRPRTPMIGRERELAVVRDLLVRPDVPLLTLTGPGGVGKTRLALQIAADAPDAFDGVAFVPLGPIQDPALVASAVADALGLTDAGDRSRWEVLVAHLWDREFLLVLDNLEQVLGAAPMVADLLAHCPRLTVLATSQVILNVSGEHHVSLAPLEPPNLSDASVDDVARSEAVQLFVARARA